MNIKTKEINRTVNIRNVKVGDILNIKYDEQFLLGVVLSDGTLLNLKTGILIPEGAINTDEEIEKVGNWDNIRIGVGI